MCYGTGCSYEREYTGECTFHGRGLFPCPNQEAEQEAPTIAPWHCPDCWENGKDTMLHMAVDGYLCPSCSSEFTQAELTSAYAHLLFAAEREKEEAIDQARAAQVESAKLGSILEGIRKAAEYRGAA